ncbi:type VII secretion-associated serine protease [Planomonospora parontospora subsp. parontospora]|uniref:Type VII secretion-associated serine protease n=2 Tax=Planomonospora parontospora TaxID=58119 RepID=A0AA37BGY1_9ACTN|nr:S8 family serine peptidase [Planomonospora parontospora]GGK69261.1 type VII secretion-associated serine protease [Planomonospora parontospora]GII08933.1 type VII secretion-associated serine protease [Planomonospora parontospora subsp. parontospora]
MLRRWRLRALGAPAVALTLVAGPVAAPAAADVREDQRWVLEALNVGQAWKATRGAGVTVALVDGEVDAEVAELRGRVTAGPAMGSAGPDGAGGGESAGRRHGTAMASLIAGAGRGDGGLLGVAPEARVLSLPLVLDGDLPAASDDDLRTRGDSPLARAIRYAADHGADVVSMSLGAYGPHRAEREAVSYALSRGVVLVAAAGNDGDSEQTERAGTSFWNFPAGYSGVIGVGAVDREGRPAPFSSDNLSVLVSAPGVDVPVVVPGGRYESSEGTSSATALVAGIAALIKAEHPRMPPDMVARAIAATADSGPVPGYDEYVGFGTVDAGKALARAGELMAAAAPVPVDEKHRFGGGALPEEAPRPGADPFRLWLYGAGLVLGVLAFAGAVVVLTRRPASR